MLQKVLKAKHGEQAMSASFSFGRALCGHLKANGRLHIQDLNAIKEQAKEDLLILDKLIEDKLEVGFDNERDCYTIKKDGQEIATANMREYAINELFKA
jgi:hypothetical protein